jgi:hypothetical protein
MLIFPFLNPGKSLFLDAYSYQIDEIATVATLLRRVVGVFETIDLERDDADRWGKRHVITSVYVGQLEKRLGLRFRGRGDTTAILVVKPLGAGYRCTEISAHGEGTGCINMSASDESEAKVKCALIAGHNAWFGGEAALGKC